MSAVIGSKKFCMVFLVTALGIEYKYVIYHNLLISVLYFFEWSIETLLPFSFFYPHHLKNTVVFKYFLLIH